MDFLNLSSIPQAKHSLDHFREWANSIASAHLNTGAPPTDGLRKIALEEELRPYEIELLATEVNKSIHSTKYASAENKYFAADFPLADAKVVIRSLQADGGEVKLAVEMPDPVIAQKDLDMYAAFGSKPEVMDKTASLRHEVRRAEQKTAAVSSHYADARALGEIEVEAAEKRLIKQARQLILEGDSSEERLKILGQLDHFLKCAGMEYAKPVMAKVAHILTKEGKLEPKDGRQVTEYFMSKTADVKAPESMISDWIRQNARVVNGEHPLYITLKTYHDKCHSLRMNTDRHNIVDDKLQIVRQRARAL